MTIDGYVLDLARDCQGVFTIERILEQSAITIILSIFIGVAEPSQSSPPIEPVANQPAEGSKYATSDDFSHAEMAVASEGNASWACRKRVEF